MLFQNLAAVFLFALTPLSVLAQESTYTSTYYNTIYSTETSYVTSTGDAPDVTPSVVPLSIASASSSSYIMPSAMPSAISSANATYHSTGHSTGPAVSGSSISYHNGTAPATAGPTQSTEPFVAGAPGAIKLSSGLAAVAVVAFFGML